MRGKVIVIEGTDCSGKETQGRLLKEALTKLGRKVEYISFPNYESATGKIIGGPLLGKEYLGKSFFLEGASNVDAKVASLLYAADRRYNMGMINDYLNDGYDLIIDRYVESNMAHQGGKIENIEERKKLYQDLYYLEYGFLGLPKPNVIIFLHVPVLKTIELLNKRAEKKDDVEADFNYLMKAEKTYLELAALHNYQVIECVDNNNELRSINDINDDVLNKVLKEIDR